MILDKTRTVITASNIPKFLWEFITDSVTKLINFTPTSKKSISPYQELYDYISPETSNIPDLSKIYTIGSTVYVYKPKELQIQSDKFENRSEKGILLGFKGNSSYIVYIPTRLFKKKVFITSYFRIFNEKKENRELKK